MITTHTSSVRKFLPLGPEGWLIRTPGYTAREVRELLRDRGRTERGRAVSRCVARPSGPRQRVRDVRRVRSPVSA